MKRLSAKGFTLIELLTVIAIISILAGMITIVGPRMIERAKITRWTQTCNEIRTTAAAFYTQNAIGSDSYPAAYGYLRADANATSKYYLNSYMVRLKYLGNLAMYDPWALKSHDTDGDGIIGLLEFSPGLVTGRDTYSYPQHLYTVANASDPEFTAEVANQMVTQRPMIYIPVNLKQAKVVSDYYYAMILRGLQTGNDNDVFDGANARRWNPEEKIEVNGKSHSLTASELRFPPTRYDDYVLISVGPGGDTGGIVTPMAVQNGGLVDLTQTFLANVQQDNWYHVLALRAYFLATRDINGNELKGNDMLDFDYRNRTRSREGTPGNYTDYYCTLNGNQVRLPGDLCHLPNGSNGQGPLIYMPNKSSI